MLESKWPRFGTLTVDSAYASMNNVLDIYIQPDGGVHEGIGYLCQTMNATLWAMIAYGRARGKDWKDEVRRRFGHVERYVAAMSGMHPGKAIPAGDCRVEWFGGDALPIMADLCPDSAFSYILGNCLTGGWVHELTGTLSKSGGLIGMVYGPDKIQASRCVVPSFDLLQQSGKVTLTTGGGDAPLTRLWISSCAQGATHAHRDLGQFVLEVDSEPVFIDRGMVQYWHIEAHFLSRSWLHNVLTPIADDGSFPSQNLPKDNRLIFVSEDRKKIDVPGNKVWDDYMEHYERRFVMDNQTTFSVIDDFVQRKNGRVAFHLHSAMEFQIYGQRAVLQNEGYSVEVVFPWAETVECRQVLVDLCQRPMFHLYAISNQNAHGQISTQFVILSRKESVRDN